MSTSVALVLVAVASAIVAGGTVAWVARRRVASAERARAAAERTRESLRTELDRVHLQLVDAAPRVPAFADVPASPAPVAELGTDAFDPVSGLLREQFIAVLIQQRVAGARRRLHPVSIVALEADGVRGRDGRAVDRAMATLGRVVRETLREADCACRVGDVVVIAALDDTAEEGARLAVERVQQGLRRASGDLGVTVSAGIASYPTHALEAPELVARAGEALLEARRAGVSRVATATPDARPA